MAEKVLGYVIEVRGTDEQVKKQAALKVSIIETTDRINTLKEATKGNIEKQKEFAGTLVNLENNLRIEKKTLGELNREIDKQSMFVKAAAGSYDELTQENKVLAEEMRAMPIDLTNKRFVELKDRIAENTLKQNQFNESIGRFQGSVGNYTGKVFTASKGLKGFADIAIVAGRAFGVNTEIITVLTESTQALASASRGMKDIQKALTVSKAADTAATGTQTAAQRLYALVVGQSTGAMAAFKVALASTGVGLVVIALGYLVSKLIEASDATSKEEEATRRLNDELEKNAQALEKVVTAREKERNARAGSLDDLNREVERLKAKGATEEEIFNKEQEIRNKELLNIGIRLHSEKEGSEKRIALAKEYADKKNEILVAELEYETKFQDKQQKRIDENAKEVQAKIKANNDEILRLSNALIKEAAEVYKRDAAEYLKSIDDKDKAAKSFYKSQLALIIDNVIKEAELGDDKVATEEAQYQKRLEALERQHDAETKKTDAFLKAKELLLKEHQQNLEEINSSQQSPSLLEKLFGVDAPTAQLIAEKSIELADNIANGIFEAQAAALDRQNEMRNNALEEQKNVDEKRIDDQLQKGIITQAKADERRQFLAKDFERKQLELKKKAFEDNKKLQLKQVAIDLAAQLMKIAIAAAALPTNATTFGATGVGYMAIYGGAAAINAAIQAGIISSSKFEDGGVAKMRKAREGMVLKGKTHAQGGIPIEAQHNEIILTDGVYENPYLRAVASMINVAGGGRSFASGGVPVPTSSPNMSSFQFGGLTKADLMEAMEAQAQMINDKRVFVVEKDISGAQKKAAVVESQNSF